MAGFVYFVPTARALEPARRVLDAAGATHVCAADPTTTVSDGGGPDKQTGLLLAPPAPPAGAQLNVLALPPDLTWYVGAKGEYHFGFSPSAPPTPADLARPEQLEGHETTLADGSVWLVPVARYFDGEMGIPHRLARKDGAWVIGDVPAQYTVLWEGACRAWDGVFGPDTDGDARELIIADGADIAAEALRANYRLGADELGALGVFDTLAMQRVLRALVDLPGFMALQKKTAAAGSPIEPGATAP